MSRTGGRKPGPGPHTGDKHTHMAHTSARAFVSYHFGRSGVHVETRRQRSVRRSELVRATVRHAYVFPRRGDSDGAALTAQSDGKCKLVKASWPNFIGSRPKMASAAGAWPLGSLRNQAFHSDAACVPAFLPWSRVREARRPEVGSRGRGALRGRRVFSPLPGERGLDVW